MHSGRLQGQLHPVLLSSLTLRICRLLIFFTSIVRRQLHVWFFGPCTGTRPRYKITYSLFHRRNRFYDYIQTSRKERDLFEIIKPMDYGLRTHDHIKNRRNKNMHLPKWLKSGAYIFSIAFWLNLCLISAQLALPLVCVYNVSVKLSICLYTGVLPHSL